MSSIDQPQRPTRHLLGKVAIVTGAGSPGDGIGNGRAISILLAEDGASIVCVDRVLESAEMTVEMIETELRNATTAKSSETKRAIAIEADVTREEDCKRIVDTTVSTFGRIDILCNNVGIIGAKGNAIELDMEQWAKGLEVNITSMVLMARFVIPQMQKNDTAASPIRGSIVNLGSVAGLQGGTPHLLYPTSKGAVVNMTRAMAAQHGKDGIRVNCVCPGMLFTPMMYMDGMSDEMRERRKNRSILKTEGNAWDCASAVRFLAGDEARWITGTVLTVDAGATAAGFV